MNRYVAKGLLDDAGNGEWVLYLGAILDQSDYALREVGREIHGRGDMQRWNVQLSKRKITCTSAGGIFFSSVGSLRALTGLKVDRVFLDVHSPLRWDLENEVFDVVRRATFGGERA